MSLFTEDELLSIAIDFIEDKDIIASNTQYSLAREIFLLLERATKFDRKKLLSEG